MICAHFVTTVVGRNIEFDIVPGIQSIRAKVGSITAIVIYTAIGRVGEIFVNQYFSTLSI